MVVRSYWLAVQENLRDVARVRAAAEFLAQSVRETETGFVRK